MVDGLVGVTACGGANRRREERLGIGLAGKSMPNVDFSKHGTLDLATSQIWPGEAQARLDNATTLA